MKKLLLTLLALLLYIAPAMAEEPEYLAEGDYIYYLTDEGAVLERCIAAGPLPEEIVLPKEIGGHPIVAYGFVYHTALTDGPVRVIVPEGVTDFGDAFGETGIFSEIVLPASLTHIEESSLYWYDAEITVHPDNPYFTCADGFLIDTRTSTLLYVAPSGQNNPLPAVKRLGDFCLYNYNVMDPVLPDTLTAIGCGVFDDWVDLTHIDIPAGVTSLGAGAFNCAGLTEITLPAGLTAIEHLTFSCNDFTEITIPEGVERIESWAFYLCPLTRVEIPASCTFVAADAFDPEVELVLLGENTHVETEEELEARERGVEHLEGNYGYALTENGAVITDYFWDEVVPEEIIVPDTLGGQPVVGVEGFAFSLPPIDCKWGPEGTCIRLPEGMKYLSRGAFYSIWSVREVHLPASLEHIGEHAFWYFNGDIVLAEGNPHFTCEDGFLIDTRTGTLLYTASSAPDGVIPAVRRIGARALDNQQLPAELTLPEGVEELAGAAFYDTQVRSVTLPESLRVIETSAFESMTITSGRIIVPATVELVEYGAFGLYSPMDAEVVILSENTRLETAMEYALRTGEFWVLEDGWEIAYTPWFAPTLAEDAVPHTEGEWAYILTDEGAVLTDWDWDFNEEPVPDVVELPATLGGVPVVGVGYNALNTPTMPGEYDFTLVIPEGVRWLEEGALQCCDNADALVLPASLVSIPEGFSHHLFARITLAQGNPRYILQDGYLIDTQTDTLIYTCPNASWEIPPVRRIGSSALDNYGLGDALDDSLWAQGVHLTIPEGVEVLGGWLFYDSLIDTVTLPESLRVIETNAIESVEITSGVVVVPAGVELIQYGAFGLYGTDLEVIVMSPDTHIETAQEYAQRTGDPLEYVLEYTCELEYTPGWE